MRSVDPAVEVQQRELPQLVDRAYDATVAGTTAEQVLREWEKTRAILNETQLRWRLAPRNEPALERVVNDTVAVAWEGVYRLKKLVRHAMRDSSWVSVLPLQQPPSSCNL